MKGSQGILCVDGIGQDWHQSGISGIMFPSNQYYIPVITCIIYLCADTTDLVRPVINNIIIQVAIFWK